jgi:hypothetical protein
MGNRPAAKRPSHTVSECLLRTATGRAGRACGWPSVASASRGHSAARTPRCSYPAPPHRAALYAYGRPPTHRSTPIRSLWQSANTRLAPDCSAPESSPVPRTRTPAPAARVRSSAPDWLGTPRPTDRPEAAVPPLHMGVWCERVREGGRGGGGGGGGTGISVLCGGA